MGNSKTDKNIIKSLNPLKFFSIVKERSQRFKNAPEIPLVEEYSINALAKKLHPSVQHVKVADIQELADGCKRFTLIPDCQNGTGELAYFSSGQYVTVFLDIGSRRDNFRFLEPKFLIVLIVKVIGHIVLQQLTGLFGCLA